MSRRRKLGIILNPVAGRGHALRCEKKLVEYLQRAKQLFSLEHSGGPGDAIQLARQMSRNFDVIVAAGGDGTVNEVVSGVAGSRASVGVLPIGSGNDFGRMVGMPKQVDRAIELIIHGARKFFDLGKISIWNSDGQLKERFFVNTLGVGLDAEIAHETKCIKYLRGLPLYLLAAIRSLVTHVSNEYEILEGKKKRVQKAFFICAGNGKYEGGGFKVLPEAQPDDMRINLCVVHSAPIIKAIRLIPKLIAGKHTKDSLVSLWESKGLTIQAKKPFLLHVDGEVLEQKALKVNVSLSKKKIGIIIPSVG
jgi:diacylglycerol kinase (ATP)